MSVMSFSRNMISYHRDEVAFLRHGSRHEGDPSLRMRASLYSAPALPARNGVFALPGLPTLAEKSQSDHACHEAAD